MAETRANTKASAKPSTKASTKSAKASTKAGTRAGSAEQIEAAKQAAVHKHIDQAQTMVFDEKNSDLDLLHARLSYATPAKDGNGYTAYLHVEWGDLNHLIDKNGPEHYSNWDGSVKLLQAGKASVVKEFAFDDHNRSTGGVERRDGLGRDSGKKAAKPGESGYGSGRDTLIRDGDNSIVAWKSAVVGATDGLLIRLDLKMAYTRGTLQAGNFMIPFVVQPLP